tara:strand:- start:10975 stop:11244 length:270 start_codon:yes stop_codon:yes gene_type:complete
MDKINEFIVGVAGVVFAVCGWIVKRLHSSVDKAHSRITILEKSLVDRPYLESQLAPIRQDLNLILSHLLEHRKTEGQTKAHLKPPPSHP